MFWKSTVLSQFFSLSKFVSKQHLVRLIFCELSLHQNTELALFCITLLWDQWNLLCFVWRRHLEDTATSLRRINTSLHFTSLHFTLHEVRSHTHSKIIAISISLRENIQQRVSQNGNKLLLGSEEQEKRRQFPRMPRVWRILAYGRGSSWNAASEALRWRFWGKACWVPRSKSLLYPYPEIVTELLKLGISRWKTQNKIRGA